MCIIDIVDGKKYSYKIQVNRLVTYDYDKNEQSKSYPLLTREELLAFIDDENETVDREKHLSIDPCDRVMFYYYRNKFADCLDNGKTSMTILRFLVKKQNLPYSCEKGSTLYDAWRGDIANKVFGSRKRSVS